MPKRQHYFSVTYNGVSDNYIVNGTADQQNEIVALGRQNVFNSFVAKFASQGGVIWSNEYYPDYPYVNWVQFPWYNNTKLTGITPGPDFTTYVYGSSIEHGKSINNVEDPPAHLVGLITQLDKFGNVLSSEYFGNWRTDYSVNNIILLANGNKLVYLRSHFYPYISKVVCISTNGNILWIAPLKANPLYSEEKTTNPVMKQLKNGHIVIAQEMVRTLDDTLQYPFMPPIILPAPLYYFNFIELDGTNGKLRWQTSYQCPTRTYTNMAPEFVPEIKNITELPNGNISFCADIYWPIDNLKFYEHRNFSRRAVNFIINSDGYVTNCIAYFPQNNSCSLEAVWQSGNNGEQVLSVKDSTGQQLILFKIDNSGKILWSKAYMSADNTSNSRQFAMEKAGNTGFFIFQGNPNSTTMHLNITNTAGNNPCSQIPVTMVAQNVLWTWLVNKVHYSEETPNIDFRYSPFQIKKKTYPLSQNTNCQYQHICCTDFIDSLNPTNISLCENESYTLPDNTVVKDSGTYYIHLKTQNGCDSVLFYKIKVLKSPSSLSASEDTCLNNSSSIQLRATEGFESYLWNSNRSSESFYPVHSPGSYTVKVENICGNKTDTINVYDYCNFPIYLPSAFTPNNDGLNDVFRIPPQNKNRFLRLTIYNRWGQIIFRAANPNDGWNGNFGKLPQPTGVYVYILEMEGLSRDRIDQKGTLTLIR
jgi:gliding motility-associated-like protein